MQNINEAKQRVEQLTFDLNNHNYNYYVLDNPTISDFEFDKLLEELITIETKFPELITSTSPSQRVGGQITKTFATVKHKYPMLSLSNSYNEEDLLEFDRRVKDGLQLNATDLFNNATIEYVCELKFDGLSIGLTYENGKLLRAAMVCKEMM
jgi:DNA ligase (NAD+)